MVRRYEEPIEVKAGVGVLGGGGDGGDGGGGGGWGGGDVGEVGEVGDIDTMVRSPSAFLWRGRLYVVRDVIGHWRERRAWWREALDPDEQVAAHGLDCLEHEVWRVEASPGRLASTGVYDLADLSDLSDSADSADSAMDRLGRGWRLLRVAD